MSKKLFLLVVFLLVSGGLLLTIQTRDVASQSSGTARDPGVRGGAAGAGGVYEGLSASQLAFFQAGQDDFAEVEEVADGLGPTMNLDSCGGCHMQPALGGSSPSVNP